MHKDQSRVKWVQSTTHVPTSSLCKLINTVWSTFEQVKNVLLNSQGFYQAVGVDDSLCIVSLVGQRDGLVEESIGSMQLPPHHTELEHNTHTNVTQT